MGQTQVAVAILVMTLLMPGMINSGLCQKISSLKRRWEEKENSYLENTTGNNADVRLCLFEYLQIVIIITLISSILSLRLNLRLLILFSKMYLCEG